MEKYSRILYLIIISLFVVLGMGSCSDNDEFTTNNGDQLTFEYDTVSFDTVFTTIGSSTKRFKVFNKNDKGIRITSVKLANGEKSGFRINVDGHSGPELNNIELLKKDSLFVFAEVTLPFQNSKELVYLKDELVFYLESGVSQKIVLEAYGQDAVILHAPIIETDTTLSNEKPYIIYDSLIVKNNSTLTIPEGTTICFHKGAYLGVYGQVVCNGSLDKIITFRSDRTDRIFSYLPYDRMDAQWDGIILYPESKNNIFDYVDIHGGNYGIHCPLSTSDDYKFYIQNSIIHNISGDGLKSYYCLGQVLNSQISNAGKNCVSLIGGSYNFVHTTIAQFYPWSGDFESALYFTNVENDTIYPLEQAYFYNCLITGRSTDEIVGNRIENNDAAFNVLFDKCLVNIKMNGNEPDNIKKMFETSINETGDTRNWPKNTDGSYSDEIVWGKKNFKLIDDDNFLYDFELSAQSKAIGICDGKYNNYCPKDLNGIERPSEKTDAGCYQYIPSENKEIKRQKLLYK